MPYERITEEDIFDGPVRDSHEIRYYIASGFLGEGDRVLDCFCGTGYGKDILTKELHDEKYIPLIKYIGIDKDAPDGPRFVSMDFEVPFDYFLRMREAKFPKEFDVFVGLESIEHLNDDGLRNYVWLAKGAKKYIIISTPIVPNSNPYHKQQFDIDKIEKLFVGDKWQTYGILKQKDTYGLFIFKRK